MRIEIVLACLAMTLVTYLCRALLTVSVARVRVSPYAERFLAIIPFAALSALVAPYLFTPGNAGELQLINPYLLAGLPTLFLAYRSRNLILSVAVGMLVYLVLGAIL
jgi:branched-subunit amino acid transport protein